MDIIKAEKLSFTYSAGRRACALHELSFTVKKGEYAVFLGGSASGKSTLALLINALLPMQQGALYVNGLDCSDESKRRDIRRSCGMLLSNFDIQFISNYAREDLYFAARNFLGDGENLDERVNAALIAVGMSGYADTTPQLLPHSLRQRLALASLLSYEPEILIFDEPFSSPDKAANAELQQIITKLHQQGKTIVLMTGEAEHTAPADKVYLLKDGKLLAEGEPREILSGRELMSQAKIVPHFPVRVYNDLQDAGVQLRRCPISIEELVDEVCL